MVTLNTRVRFALDRLRAEAFLAAGVLLLASPTHVVLELFMDVPLPSWLVALFVLPGLIATLVGLVGLYPRIADCAPRVALAAGVVTIVAGMILVVLLGWILGGSVLMTVPGVGVGMPPGILFLSLAMTLTLAFVLFGSASLRFAVPSRAVGLLLLSFALPWIVSLAATSVYGSTFPDWLTMAIYGPIPFVMLGTGYALRIESAPTGQDDDSVDLATG